MAVEFAILFPVFLVLLFGAVDIGGMFRHSNVLQAASAHGARTASVLSRDASFAEEARKTVASELATAGIVGTKIIVFKADRLSGRPVDVSADEPIDACTLCDVWNWSVETGTWEKTATTWDASDQSACGRLIDDVDTSDYVGVFVSANYKPITGISAPVLGGNRLLARSTTMRLEPVAPMALDDPC